MMVAQEKSLIFRPERGTKLTKRKNKINNGRKKNLSLMMTLVIRAEIKAHICNKINLINMVFPQIVYCI